MKFKVKEKEYGIVDLYDEVAKEMGYIPSDDIHYDCTKINIANNIQEGFYEYYKQRVNPEYAYYPESEINCQITMILAMSGPKVDKDLEHNEVEVFDGFIIDKRKDAAV